MLVPAVPGSGMYPSVWLIRLNNSILRWLLMSKMVEIRWHGRGGQGAKTASLALADVAFLAGKYVQGFPEYGPERMGAPIAAYNRISDERCASHSNIYKPDYVVVVDETLLVALDVTAGLSEKGAIIINSDKSPDQLASKLKGYKGKVCTIDASKIALETIGRNIPNTSMLAAVVKISGVISEEEFISKMETSFKHQFATKPQVIEGNMAALKRSMQEVKTLC
jgi:pyruvate ferredoxin oxidoreductase gamma subunit